MQPLPRSLAPLPDESIVGYLLRLACRLAVSPLDLARMAGWLEGRRGGLAHLSRKLLLELGQEDAGSFAQLTRLTVSEAHSLTLGSWKGHYPPIQRSLAAAGGPSWPDSWLFLSSRATALNAWPVTVHPSSSSSEALGRNSGTCPWSSPASSTAPSCRTAARAAKTRWTAPHG